MSDTRLHVHEWMDPLPATQLNALAASREYFEKCCEVLSFEQVVAECGFTLEQIRSSK